MLTNRYSSNLKLFKVEEFGIVSSIDEDARILKIIISLFYHPSVPINFFSNVCSRSLIYTFPFKNPISNIFFRYLISRIITALLRFELPRSNLIIKAGCIFSNIEINRLYNSLLLRPHRVFSVIGGGKGKKEDRQERWKGDDEWCRVSLQGNAIILLLGGWVLMGWKSGASCRGWLTGKGEGGFWNLIIMAMLFVSCENMIFFYRAC